MVSWFLREMLEAKMKSKFHLHIRLNEITYNCYDCSLVTSLTISPLIHTKKVKLEGTFENLCRLHCKPCDLIVLHFCRSERRSLGEGEVGVQGSKSSQIHLSGERRQVWEWIL